MKFAKISFQTREVAARAYVELAKRGQVVSLADGCFIVPEPAVAFLNSEGFAHQIHAWLNSDHVTQTLRNSPAHSL